MILDAFDKLIIFYFFTFVHFQTQNSIKDFVQYLQRLKKYFSLAFDGLPSHFKVSLKN